VLWWPLEWRKRGQHQRTLTTETIGVSDDCQGRSSLLVGIWGLFTFPVLSLRFMLEICEEQLEDLLKELGKEPKDIELDGKRR
jgi:hypothetical protein